MKSASTATFSLQRNMKQIGCQLSSLCKLVGLCDLYLELTQSLHGPLQIVGIRLWCISWDAFWGGL